MRNSVNKTSRITFWHHTKCTTFTIYGIYVCMFIYAHSKASGHDKSHLPRACGFVLSSLALLNFKRKLNTLFAQCSVFESTCFWCIFRGIVDMTAKQKLCWSFRSKCDFSYGWLIFEFETKAKLLLLFDLKFWYINYIGGFSVLICIWKFSFVDPNFWENVYVEFISYWRLSFVYITNIFSENNGFPDENFRVYYFPDFLWAFSVEFTCFIKYT